MLKKATTDSSQSQDPQIVSDAITEYLSSFNPLTRKPDEVRKGNKLPAHFDIHAPAYAKSNRAAAGEAVKAARDHSLQSPRFEAVRGKWSDKLQMVLLIPESTYVESDPELYRVSWSSDGFEMRFDLAEALVPRQWGTPSGFIRRVKATLHRHLPEYGSALVLDLPGGDIREAPEVVRERKLRKAGGGQASAAGEQAAAEKARQGAAGKGVSTGAAKPDQSASKNEPAPGKEQAKPEPAPGSNGQVAPGA